MARDWESTFISWAKGPGATEDERCENAIGAIRAAANKDDGLADRDIEILLLGSYRNRVNARQNSDVDVGILCHDVYFYDLPENFTPEDFEITSASYTYTQFKNEVEQALVNHFGRQAVHRGNKAFDIHENSYRVDADVAPFFDHRRYTATGHYHEGVELRPDNGGRIINWPEQHYANGVSKNKATMRRFKRFVRILKRLRVEMDEQGVPAARDICGFLIECMAYNVPNENFGHATYTEDVRDVLAFLFNNTINDEDCTNWVEVSELKWLFYPAQAWTRQQAHAFISAAWNYLGFN